MTSTHYVTKPMAMAGAGASARSCHISPFAICGAVSFVGWTSLDTNGTERPKGLGGLLTA